MVWENEQFIFKWTANIICKTKNNQQTTTHCFTSLALLIYITYTTLNSRWLCQAIIKAIADVSLEIFQQNNLYLKMPLKNIPSSIRNVAVVIAEETIHDDVIKWKHFPHYWPFVRGIQWSPVNFPHKGQSRGVLMFSLICARLIGWVNNRGAGNLRRHRAHYDVIVMCGIQLSQVERRTNRERKLPTVLVSILLQRYSTYGDQAKVADILQLTRSNAFSRMEMMIFWFDRKCQDYVYITWQYWSTL